MSAPTRLGPRPLPLHMANLAAAQALALPDLAALKAGSLNVAEGLEDGFADLKAAIESCGWGAVEAAVAACGRARYFAALKGISLYQRHPFARTASASVCCYQIGTTLLQDYGGAGKPLLLVPSLINPADILDLLPGHSLIAALKARGFRPFLVDWTRPGQTEKQFLLGDYVSQRLVPVLDALTEQVGGPVPVIGYCMGGTLAVALASRRAERVKRLALLAAPWDFAQMGDRARRIAVALTQTAELFERYGEAPFDIIQLFFTSLDPGLTERKFGDFSRLDQESDKAKFFVALEDWVNGGAPMAGPAARECLTDWYGANRPGRGDWQVGGAAVDPATIRLPAFLVAPTRDRIVPHPCAYALAGQLGGTVDIHTPAGGHVGMVAGSRAQALLWDPLCDWLAASTG